MSYADSITFPFSFFVSLVGDLVDFSPFWAVMVALVLCGTSYLIRVFVFGGKRYD